MDSKYPGAEAATVITPRCIANLRCQYFELEEVPFFPDEQKDYFVHQPHEVACYEIGLSYGTNWGRAYTRRNHIDPIRIEYPVNMWERYEWFSSLLFNRSLHCFDSEVRYHETTDSIRYHNPEQSSVDSVVDSLMCCEFCNDEKGFFQFLVIFVYDADTNPGDYKGFPLQDMFERLVLVGKCENCKKSSFLYDVVTEARP